MARYGWEADNHPIGYHDYCTRTIGTSVARMTLFQICIIRTRRAVSTRLDQPKCTTELYVCMQNELGTHLFVGMCMLDKIRLKRNI